MKELTNLYAKAMETSAKQSGIAPMKYFLTLVMLLFISSNAWSQRWSWTVNVGVASGKGTAKAEIIKHVVLEYWEAECSSSTLTLGSTSVTTNNLFATSNSNRSYKYTATPENGYSFSGWYNGTDVTGTPYSTSNPMTGGQTNKGFNHTFYAKFIPVTVNSIYSNPIPEANPLSLVEPGYKTKTVSFQVSNNADSKDDFYEPTIVGEGWSIDSWTLNGNIVNVTVRFTATQTTTQGMHTAQLTLTSKANSTASTTVAAVVDLTPALNANPEELDFGMFTVNVDTKMSKTVALSFNVNAIYFEKTNDASITPFSAVLSADNKTLTVYYEPTEVGTGVWEKIITITARNNQNPQLTVSKEIKLKGQAQGITNPEYTCNIADEYKVDDASLDLQNLWTSTSNGAVTYTIESFVPSGINNDRATAPSITDNRYLSLGQAGTLKLKLTQEEATFYYAGADTKTITITKYDNALNCSWGEWTKKMSFDETQSVTFSANNTNSTTPIQIAQIDGDTIAQYVSGSVNSFHNKGTATWKVWQEEDYKYKAAEAKTLTVNVGTETTTCYIINDPNEYVLGKGLDPIEDGVPFSLNAQKGDKLYFEGRKTNLAASYFFIQYSTNGGETYSEEVKQDLEPEWKTYGPYFIPENTTHIRFKTKTGATLQKYYRNIKVTRAQWFDIEDKNGNVITSLTMPTNTIGGNATTEDFYIDYSTCAEEIKLHCSHPHITFDNGATTTQFDSNGSGKQKITLSYSSDKVEDITATITIYTPYEHKTITITAKTEKEKQELIWQDGYNGNPITLPVSLKTDNAAVASSGLQVIYSTDPTGVIKIADDGKSFEIIAEGTATLTATQAGNETFLPVTETKTVYAVDKKIQYIVWNQDFTHGLHVDDLITLNACAYVMNIKDSTIVLSDERTALIQYSCPANNGVISIVDGKITIIGYGETTITATLDGDEKHFEAAPVTKRVYVRQYNEGDCENIPVFLKDDEIEFFAFDLTTPKIVKDIKLDRTQGVPDKLNFYVRGVSYNVVIQYYRYGIDVYQSTDNGNSWGEKIGSVWPEKNTTLYSDSIQLSPDATHIRFVRPDNAWGYHYVGGVVVSRLQFIETENELIDLGNVAAGAVREGKIRFNYSDVKKDLQVTKEIDSQINKLDLDKTTIEVECGATDKDSIAFTFKPMQVGEWTNKVTITDPKTGKSKTVTLKATVTIGTQQIIWNPETNIKQNTPPQLDAVATSGLPVTYEVTSGTDVATIQDGQVIIHKTGTFTITASQAGNNSFNKAADLSIIFTVSEYEQFIFETDGEWTTTTNWNKKQLPGENNDVIINANVTIIGDVVVNSMIINDTVIVKGKLTIKNNSSEGNSDLIIHAELGDNNKSASSGQVIGAEKLKIKDAYFQMTFDPSGQITYGWYDFVVPFEVNITDGIFRQGETKPLRNGVDFIVMQHSEAACAAGQKDWKTYTGIMYPGKAYTITFDNEVTQNTFLFKKRSEASLINSNTLNAEYTQSGQEKNRGWNGFGNGTLQHKQLQSTGTKVQIYDHTNNVYRTKEADKYVFAIGTSFFVQTNQQQQIILADADANRPILAPAREGRTIDEFRLALTAENENNANDYMWVSASENANGTYTIGHDLLKKGTPTDAKLAQMWTTREYIRLCDIEMQLINEQAQCTIDFFAPQTKQYTLHVEKAPKDANLYLTYNNQIIWNLTATPYNLDLNKGTTTGYGLLLEANRAPQITTGTEQTITDEQNTARKILINNQIYLITPDGAIYTMMGTKIQ